MSSENPDTRTRILSSTLKLMEANPHKQVRMSDIAKAAGISRQAVYLHFPTRAELLVETTHYVGEVTKIDERLKPWVEAERGLDKLDLYIEGWAVHVTEVYGMMTALLAMMDTDEAAKAGYDDRMRAMRNACQTMVEAMRRDGDLADGISLEEARDILWTLTSVQNWERFTQDCGWSHADYVSRVKRMVRQLLMP